MKDAGHIGCALNAVRGRRKSPAPFPKSKLSMLDIAFSTVNLLLFYETFGLFSENVLLEVYWRLLPVLIVNKIAPGCAGLLTTRSSL